MMVDCIGCQGSGGTSEAICLISALLAYYLTPPCVKRKLFEWSRKGQNCLCIDNQGIKMILLVKSQVLEELQC